MKLPIQSQPFKRHARTSRPNRELTQLIMPSESDLTCCLRYEQGRDDCMGYWDADDKKRCLITNGNRHNACMLHSRSKCRKHWEDSNTVGYTCEQKSSCESIRNFWNDRCWGSCDDRKVYCTKDKIGSCQNL